MEVKWIKLSTGIFDNRKIRQIENMPDGDALVVIWLKLLILAGEINDGGCVYFTKDIPFTDQLLATQFNRPLSTVQLALSTFQRFEMIEIVNDLIRVSNWEKYQNVDGLDKVREQNRLRQSAWRERQKLLPNVTDNVTVTQDTAIDKNKKESEIKEKDIEVKTKRFVPPTVDEVRAYCAERKNSVNAERFVDFYQAKGWKVGNNSMKDWRACVRTWEQRDKATDYQGKKVTAQQYEQREYTEEELEARATDILNEARNIE